MKEIRVRAARSKARALDGYQHLLYLPHGYRNERKADKYPLVLFLHGAGERGSNLKLVKVHGVPRRIASGAEFPFIALAPQCPSGEVWDPGRLEALVDATIGAYNVDTNRIYVTGISMGGAGTWALANRCPDRLAAIVPICGPRLFIPAERLCNLPIWVFHGAMDNAVPIDDSVRMVRGIREAGGNVKFTVYADSDHDSWTETYNNAVVYDWLLSKALKKPRRV